MWDLQTKKIRLKHFQAHPWSFAVAFSPDGKLLACHRGGPPHVVQLWDWDAGKQVAELQGFVGHIYEMAFSSDGKLFAIVDAMHVRLWDTATGELVGLLAGPRETIRALAWSPDGKTLATSNGPKVKLWNVATRQELTTFVGSNGAYWHTFTPDGSLLVADAMNTIRLWRTGLDQNAR